MVIKYINSILFLLFICMSCGVMKENMLSLDKLENASNALKINGYYYYEFQSDVPRYRMYFLYKNGVALLGDNPSVIEINEEEGRIQSGQLYELIKDQKFKWGVFRLEGNEIKIERWYPSERPYKTFLETGIILNDSTFRITKFSKPDGSDSEVRDELYHFKGLSPKPDSTNVFIK